MDAVSVESINRLLDFYDKLSDLESHFNHGFECVRADATLAREQTRARLEEIRNERVDAEGEVENCKNDLDRIKDERRDLNHHKDEYDPDDFEMEMGYLDDDYDDAKEKLDMARRNLEKARARENMGQQHCNVVERWSERILFLSDSAILHDFENCRSFIRSYGSYLAELVKSM